MAALFRQRSTSCIRRDGLRRDQQQEMDQYEDKAADELDDPDPDPSEYLIPKELITAADLGPEERAEYETLSKKEQESYLALQNHYAAIFESAESEEAMSALVDQVHHEVEAETEPLDFPVVGFSKRDEGYWAMDEDDEFGQVEDVDEEDESDITSTAHNELDLHREVREYTRVIAWDMPLLQSK